MNDDQLQAWLDQHGGEVGRKDNEKEVDDPSSINENTGLPNKKKTVDSTTITAKDGATITLRRSPEGSGTTYQVIENTPAKPTSASTSKPAIPPGGSSVTEGTPDPNAPGGWDNNRPRQVIRDAQGNVIWSEELTGADLNAWRQQQQANQPQTGEERKPVQGRPGWTSVTRTVVQGGNKTETTVYVGPDGKEVPTLPNETGVVRVPVEGHPGVYLVTRKDGPNQATHYENEAGQKVPQPAAAPSYSVTQRTINGQTFTIITKTPKDGSAPTITNYGPDGQPVSALPTEGVGNIPGLPTYVPDLTKPGAGLFDYAKQLDEFMKANPSFTWEKRQQVLEAAQKQASTVVQEFNTGAAILREQYQTNVTQRGQDMTQANNRAQLANTHHQNAIGLIEKFAPYLGVTSGDAGKLFLGMMASQLATATAYGGMQNYGREEMDPRLLSFADRAVGGASRPGSPTPPGTPPNALGLGGPGAMFTPQGWTPPPANPDAAMAEAVRQQRAASGAPLPAPLLGPQAVPDTGAPYNPAQASPLLPPTNVPDTGAPYNPPSATPAAPFPPSVIPQTGGATDPPLPPVGGRLPEAQPSPIDPIMPNPATQSMVPPGLEAMFANVLPPEPVSWHERAQAQASAFEQPTNVARMESLIGGAVPSGPMFGGFSMGGPVAQAPLPLASRIPGLTPEADAEARRQLAMGV